MAEYIPYKTTKEKMDTVPVVEGQLFFCTDNKKIYLDTINTVASGRIELNSVTTKTITIQPQEWVNGEYTVSDDLITENSIQEFILPEFSDINTEIITALLKAQLVDNGQEKGKARIKCLGIIPKVTVKLKVIFRS